MSKQSPADGPGRPTKKVQAPQYGRHRSIYLSKQNQDLVDRLRAAYGSDNELFIAGLHALAGHDPALDVSRLITQNRHDLLYKTWLALLEAYDSPVPAPQLSALRTTLSFLIGDILPPIEKAVQDYLARTRTDGSKGKSPAPTLTQPRALVIEDEPNHAFLAERLLEEAGFSPIHTARDLLEGEQRALDLLNPNHPAQPTLIILDLMFPSLSSTDNPEGTDLAARLTDAMERNMLHHAVIVALSGEVTPARKAQALRAGCRDILTKPFQPDEAKRLRQLMHDGQERTIPLRTVVSASSTPATEPHHTPEHPATVPQRRNDSDVAQEDPVVWDAEHVDDLLFAPPKVYGTEPWKSWLIQRGGIAKVRNALLDQTRFKKDVYRLFSVLLTRQYIAKEEVLAEIGISEDTYRRYLDTIIEQCILALNGWAKE